MLIKKTPGQTTTALVYLSSGSDAGGGTFTLGKQTIVASMTATETAALLTDVVVFSVLYGGGYDRLRRISDGK